MKHYVAAGGAVPFRTPRRPKTLGGHEDWLRERFVRHRVNADVVRQEHLAEKGLAISLRTLQRALQPYRQALKAEALATIRFETPPGRQLQIDFGERLVEIGGARIKTFVFVAMLGTRAAAMCGRSASRSWRAGSQVSRAPSWPSAACRRRC